MEISTVNIHNLTIEGFSGDYVFNTIKNTNNFYENDLLIRWKKYTDDAEIIFDVGANIGNHSLYWSINTDVSKIYSFEPYFPSYARLENNININNLADRYFPLCTLNLCKLNLDIHV